jgi:hypothetical protein
LLQWQSSIREWRLHDKRWSEAMKPLPWLLLVLMAAALLVAAQVVGALGVLVELWRQWLRLLWLVVLGVAFVVCAWRVIVVRDKER